LMLIWPTHYRGWDFGCHQLRVLKGIKSWTMCTIRSFETDISSIPCCGSFGAAGRLMPTGPIPMFHSLAQNAFAFSFR
jgi:hypothetical protein